MNKYSSYGGIGADEAVLIDGLRAGSVLAFNVLYRLYFQRIYGYCLQFTKSRHDAEDIVQEVFTQLWVNRSKITAENSLKSLLYVIARNMLVKAYRQNINSPVFEDYMDYCNSLESSDASTVEYREFVDVLNRCISELPDRQQQAVRLSKFEQLSNKEISERLGLSEQTVKNYLFQALQYIRRKLRSFVISIIAIVLIFS